MEQQGQANSETSSASGWAAWDAVPRDGPAVFVIETALLEREGRLRGAWIELGSDPAAINAQLAAFLADDAETGSWAIVDQVGLGGRMVPEDVPLDHLHGLAHGRAAEESL